MSRRLAALAIALAACCARTACSQTPSPLQEWQYEGGIILSQLFEPAPPKWRTVLGLSAQVAPLYTGSKPYRVDGGPVVDIRYRDIAFISAGEGIGVNLLHGEHYRAGVAMAYDLGRDTSDYESHLHGLPDISAAPAVKLFGSVVLSRKFPLVLRADARQYAGGAEGLIGDLSAYLPLPGSSRRFVMFAGPSVTFADHHYMQTEFGVDAAHSLTSGYPAFYPHGGMSAEGAGFSATWFITPRVLLNTNMAISRLRGGAAESPITQETTQRVVNLAAAYMW